MKKKPVKKFAVYLSERQWDYVLSLLAFQEAGLSLFVGKKKEKKSLMELMDKIFNIIEQQK